jgi:8-oxoguanine deaminase
VRLHTHLAETLDEEDFCLQRFGLRTVDYLDSVGWLGPRTWLAHGIHFNPDEIARLGRPAPVSAIARARTCAWPPASARPSI